MRDCQRLTERRISNNCIGSARDMAGYCFMLISVAQVLLVLV